MAELRNETFVLHEENSSTHKLFIEWIRANGGTVGDTIDVTCPEAVKSLAQTGLGVGVLSAHAVADRASRSRLAIVQTHVHAAIAEVATARLWAASDREELTIEWVAQLFAWIEEKLGELMITDNHGRRDPDESEVSE